MKKLILSCLLLLPVITLVWGQKSPEKFGKANAEELEMTVCRIDTSAGAAVLFDIGQSEITYDPHSGWINTHTRHTRIKVFKASGYQYASFDIPLYHNASGEEKITFLKGVTYNLDGKEVVISKLDKDQIFTEEAHKYLNRVKFEMPDVKEGSVIEVILTIKSDFFDIREWYFQTGIPTLLSEYHTRIPSYFKFHIFQKGYERFTTEKDYRSETISQMVNNSSKQYNTAPNYSQATINFTSELLHMKAVNMPALYVEGYTLNRDNYATSVNYELNYYQFDRGGSYERTTSWKRVNEILMEDFDFGLQIGKTGYAREEIDRIMAATEDPHERLAMAYDHVKDYLVWNKYNLHFVNTNLRDVYNKKAGNAAEINFILLNMLKEMGIKADPVVLSTRSNGIIPPTHATLDKLNYMIVRACIGEEVILLDATDPYFKPGILPERCLNGTGVMISSTVELGTSLTSTSNSLYQLTLDEEGILSGNLTYSKTGYLGISEKKEYEDATEDEEYIRSITDDNPGMHVKEYSIRTDSSKTDRFVLNLDIEAENQVAVMGDMLTIPVMLYEAFDENPFKLDERKYPVNFTFPREYTTIISIAIPETYSIDELPKPALVSLPDNAGKFMFNITVNNNNLQLISRVFLNKVEFLPAEYELLKEFFNLIIDKHAESILLKKTEI